MADLPKIDIEGSTEPAVALALLRIIMETTKDQETHDRDWILSTYADCLAVVGGAEIDYGEEEEKAEDS